MEGISIENTIHLGLPLLIPNQAQKEITHNEALVILDNLVQNAVITRNLIIPPEEPKINDLYIIGENAVDIWLNKDFQLAFYDNGWRFIEPKEGFTFWVKDENCQYTYNGDNWVRTDEISNKKINLIDLQDVEVDNIKNGEFLRYDGNKFINTRSFDNIENLKINKFEESATASCILQDNLIDKVEFGLMQDDNFTLKVSTDGKNWNNSFVIDNESGNIDFKGNITMNGNSFVNIETYNDENGNWYRKYSDGWVEQGGLLPAIASNTYVANFLVPFKDLNYNILKCGFANYDGAPFERFIGFYSKTKTSATTSLAASHKNCTWFASGYYE